MVEQVSGNTNPTPESENSNESTGRGKYVHAWCFTWNLGNAESSGLDDLNSWHQLAGFQALATSESRGVAQLEKAPETGQLHIQGYIEFKVRKRLLSLKRAFGSRVHWEARRGPREAAVKYCNKEESRVGEFFQWTNYGDPLRTEFPPPVEPLRRVVLSDMYGWQRTVIDEAKLLEPCPADNRTVTYVWSPFGKVGKSKFAKYLVDRYDQNWLVCAGGTANIAYHIKTFMDNPVAELAYLHGVVIDIPRCRTNDENVKTISAPAVECIKNGLVFSSKYESGQLRFNDVHVIILSNAPPPLDELSTDRWSVYQLDERGNIEGRD
jgi:hypothetical protein